MNNLKIIIIIMVTISSFYARASEKIDFPQLIVSEVAAGDSNLYVFELCDPGSCSVVGEPLGYTLKEIKGLSGLIQKSVGAPLLGVSQAAAGLTVAFFVGLWAVPYTVTNAMIYTILGSGATVGAAAPSLFSSTSVVYKMSPAYQWNKGGAKIELEQATEHLADDATENPVIIFQPSDFDSLETFYEKLELVEVILSQI